MLDLAQHDDMMDDFEATIVVSNDDDGENTSTLSSSDDDNPSLPLSSDLIHIHQIQISKRASQSSDEIRYR